jgi:hypothetical protein
MYFSTEDSSSDNFGKQFLKTTHIDGTANEDGAVTEVVDLILRYKTHSEWTLFTVSNLEKQKLILRHSWLHKHNPEINWETGEVKMSRCPPWCCTGCREDAWQEQITRKAEIRQKETCSNGPILELHHDMDDVDDFDNEGKCIDQDNQIFASGLLPSHPSKNICLHPLSQLILQRLLKLTWKPMHLLFQTI